MREVDRRAVERLGIPSLLLMENAAAGCAAIALEMLGGRAGPVLIACGRGNNGGDGLAMLRHLDAAGVAATAVLTCGQPGTTDARVNLEIAQRAGLDVRLAGGEAAAWFGVVAEMVRPALVVDALFGTGLNRAVGAEVAGVIAAIAARRAGGAQVLAVDVPSGLDADAGVPLGVEEGACVRADVTATLAALKPGLRSAREWTGEVRVVGIGVPRGLMEGVVREGD